MQIIKPMLAKSAVLPSEDNAYGFEIKWDGMRAILYCEFGNLHILSRTQRDVTPQYPEFQPLSKFFLKQQVILDGEIVALDAKGRPSFENLQHRMGLTAKKMIQLKMLDIPVTYVIFDLLYLNTKSIMDFPYNERRQRLTALQLDGPAWQTPDYQIGDGQAIITATRNLGLEGVIAKQLASHYSPGERTGEWLKIKNQHRQELVIAGWLPGKGARRGRIGSLLLGYYDVMPQEALTRKMPQRLLYAGKAGTGFTEATLDKLATLLEPLRSATTPFADQAAPTEAIFVKPLLVGEFEFTEWTSNHTLRHPSFKGLRNDKNANSVIREDDQRRSL